ncbi:MAG: hypothetical protein ACTH8B_22605 [Serratia proteamaculans]
MLSTDSRFLFSPRELKAPGFSNASFSLLLVLLSAAETFNGLKTTLPFPSSAPFCAAVAAPLSAIPAPIRLTINLIFIYPQKLPKRFGGRQCPAKSPPESTVNLFFYSVNKPPGLLPDGDSGYFCVF